MTLVISLVVAGAAVAATLLVVRRSRRQPSALPAEHMTGSSVLARSDQEPSRAEATSESVMLLTTDRPGEVVAFGSPSQLDALGSTLATLPDQLARHAVTTRALVDGARAMGESSGRLVLVDPTTAAAMRAGTLVRDGGGKLLAIGRDANGRFASVARIQQVGGAVASVTALTNAASAMALQAQLNRIEESLEAMAEKLDDIRREQAILADADRTSTEQLLARTYAAARSAGVLTTANWQVVSSLAKPILAAVDADRQRLRDAVGKLDALSRDKVKARTRQITDAVNEVRAAHHAYVRSCRSWVQYSTLHLWHLTVTDDPTLPQYEDQLRSFIEDSRSLRETGLQALAALDVAAEFRRLLHPIARRRLPDAIDGERTALEATNWTPLVLTDSVPSRPNS